MSGRFAMFACLLTTGTVRAETLTLPLDKRPDWVRQDGIVMAGSWEALPMRARIFGPYTYTPTAEQRDAYLREHSPEMIARLKDFGGWRSSSNNPDPASNGDRAFGPYPVALASDQSEFHP